ncbi:MAG: hypothetical protein P8X70_00165 [Nanoarchaeota archaeon]
MKKKVKEAILIFSILILSIFAILYLSFSERQEIFKKVCGDGTLEGDCSINKPYFCFNKTLIENSQFCDCPDVLIKKEDSCFSKYQTGSKEVELNYILRGEEGKIKFILYKGLLDYIEKLPKTISYSSGQKPSRQDFKFKKIDEPQQRELLLPLVVKLQNNFDEIDQARVAVSIVQNLNYGGSGRNITLGANYVNYSRYPYEVLYDLEGACESKSELLAFLLRELGYGVVLFYYPIEKHEVVGVKCPEKYGLNNTGYCFIETTGPSIISNDEEYYSGLGKLSSSPEILFISEGKSLGDNLYEYKDAEDFIRLSRIVQDTGELNIFRHNRFKELKEKYGLNHI